jgi:hypothetical protein
MGKTSVIVYLSEEAKFSLGYCCKLFLGDDGTFRKLLKVFYIPEFTLGKSISS